MDENHARMVDEALSGDATEFPVQMTFGELFLFHTLLQDFGLELVNEERIIPLMIRNKARLDGLS